MPATSSAVAPGCANCVGRRRGAASAAARIIYYWHVPGGHIYLIYGYVKSEKEDLTPQQVRTLAELVKDIKHG
jgi:TM2 domain-containing membrane protein YozV